VGTWFNTREILSSSCGQTPSRAGTGRITIEEGAYFKGGVEIDSRNTQIGTDLDTLLKGAKKAEER